MAETYAFVENATSTITLPLDIDYSPELANKIAIVKCGMGPHGKPSQKNELPHPILNRLNTLITLKPSTLN